SEEHTSELQSLAYLVCRLLLEKKNAISVDVLSHVEQGPVRQRKHPQALVRALAHVVQRPHLLALLLRVPAVVFFFNDTETTEIYTLSLHDALPIRPNCRTSRTPGTTTSSSGCERCATA